MESIQISGSVSQAPAALATAAASAAATTVAMATVMAEQQPQQLAAGVVAAATTTMMTAGVAAAAMAAAAGAAAATTTTMAARYEGRVGGPKRHRCVYMSTRYKRVHERSMGGSGGYMPFIPRPPLPFPLTKF